MGRVARAKYSASSLPHGATHWLQTCSTCGEVTQKAAAPLMPFEMSSTSPALVPGSGNKIRLGGLAMDDL